MKVFSKMTLFSLWFLLCIFASSNVFATKIGFNLFAVSAPSQPEIELTENETWQSFKRKVENTLGACQEIIVVYKGASYNEANFSAFLKVLPGLSERPWLRVKFSPHLVTFSGSLEDGSNFPKRFQFKHEIKAPIAQQMIKVLIACKLNQAHPTLVNSITWQDIELSISGDMLDPSKLDTREVKFTLSSRPIYLVLNGPDGFMAQLNEEQKRPVFKLTKLHTAKTIKDFICRFFDYTIQEGSINIREPFDYFSGNNEIDIYLDEGKELPNKYTVNIFHNYGQNSYQISGWYLLDKTIGNLRYHIGEIVKKNHNVKRVNLLLYDNNDNLIVDHTKTIDSFKGQFKAFLDFDLQKKVYLLSYYEYNQSMPDYLKWLSNSYFMVDENFETRDIIAFIKNQVKRECAIERVGNTFKVLFNPDSYYQQITVEELKDALNNLRKHAVNAPLKILWGDTSAYNQFYEKNVINLISEITEQTKNNIDLYSENILKLNYLIELNPWTKWSEDAKKSINNLKADYEMAQHVKEFAALSEGCWNNMSLFVDNKAKLEKVLNDMRPNDHIWREHKATFDLLSEAYVQHDAYCKREEFEGLLQEGHKIIEQFEASHGQEGVTSLPGIEYKLQQLLEAINKSAEGDGETYQERFIDFKTKSEIVSNQWFEIYFKPLMRQFKE